MRTLSILFIAAAAHLAAADFFPLAPGNQWQYRDSVTGESFTVEIGATQFYLNDRVYHSLRGYTPERLIVRLNEFGNLVYWDEERQADILLTSFEFAGPGRFEAPKRQCAADGQVQERRGVHDGPAGRWSVIEIQYRTFSCGDTGEQLEQYAENIGLVRRVVTTFVGPRTFDLVYARIGKQVITAHNNGSFSISAIPDPGVAGWKATLRIDESTGLPLTLRFPSSQEYDLRLRDPNGTVLWTWSANKLFAQAAHEIVISGCWTASVIVPFPPAIPEGSQVYTLEAFLTTGERQPGFGAVVWLGTPATPVNEARTGRSR